MARLSSTRTGRAHEMHRVLERWEGSGLTLREFGRREGISPSTLSWWRHVFHRKGKPRLGRRGRMLGGRLRSRRKAKFVELKVANEFAPPPAAIVEVIVRSGHVLRVPAGVERTALREMVAALEEAC